MNYDAIFWDWNGTLVDDREYNVDCINKVLFKYGFSPIDEKTYFQTFGFPIIDFYKKIGFDFSVASYEEVADEYMRVYNAHADEVPLRRGAKEALAVYADKGMKQYILTASHKEVVDHGVSCRGIEKYFSHVIGREDCLAGGKTEAGRKFMSEHAPGRAILIGDTLHDAFVAGELGLDCVLLRGGHASDDTLSASGRPIADAPNGTYRFILPTGGTVKTTVDFTFISKYKAFYDDLKNTSKTEDW